MSIEKAFQKISERFVLEAEAKDKRIKELEDELEEVESARYAEERKAEYEEAWRWRHVRKLRGSRYLEDTFVVDTNWDLPVPRLEIRWRRYDEYNRIADYGIVIEHLLGSIDFIPISSTKQSGPNARGACGIHGILDSPWRDGCHALNDAKQLKLPLFVVSEEPACWRQVDTSKDTLEEFTEDDVTHMVDVDVDVAEEEE